VIGEIDNVLVLNCGSSSVKFRLIATDPDLIGQNAERRLAKGTIERIGGEAIIRLKVEGRDPQRTTSSLRTSMPPLTSSRAGLHRPNRFQLNGASVCHSSICAIGSVGGIEKSQTVH
jgi:hypothetical protein